MALQAAYTQFLAAPNPSLLAENASLHYITTLVTVTGASQIIKHLDSQRRHLVKKEEKLLDVVQGQCALALEAHTTIEFLSGGGSYLPGLDDNFLTDRTVTLPIIHFVAFDTDGKILQVRQSWDQGSLLKLLDVIGGTGRNWPIRDGKAQIQLITSSVKGGKATTGDATSEQGDVTQRSRGNSTQATRDPHATLHLVEPLLEEEPVQESVQESVPAALPRRASAKPAPRDYHELFVGNDSDKSPAAARPASPSKESIVAPKRGAGKNYGPSRIFDNDENSPIRPSPDKNHSADHMLRANPTKYNHFEFADGSDPQDAPRPAPVTDKKDKHGTQWTFDDFYSPLKFVPTKVIHPANAVHWGTADDEVLDSPVKVKKVDKPRKDADIHFEFKDDGTPQPRSASRPRGAGQNNGLGLYQDNFFDEGTAGGAGDKGPKPWTSIANVKDRSKDFDAHFSMADASPFITQDPEKIPEDRAKAVKMMEANWTSQDQSPNQKENLPVSPSPNPNAAAGKGGPLSETTTTASNRNDHPKGINISGDGMGGKKGTSRNWGFGDESDGEEVGGVNWKGNKFKTGKQLGKAQPTGGDFWDF